MTQPIPLQCNADEYIDIMHSYRMFQVGKPWSDKRINRFYKLLEKASIDTKNEYDSRTFDSFWKLSWYTKSPEIKNRYI